MWCSWRLSSIVNACWDLWAKSRDLPLWRLLLDLEPEQVLATLHLRYLEDALSEAEALAILRDETARRSAREQILETGYPGYDTSIGWFQYSDDTIKDNILKSMDQGFGSVKLKVGSEDAGRDIRRAFLVRETVGDSVRVMLDCNQQWTLSQAIAMCEQVRDMNPFWIEEPTHPR